MRRVDRSLPIAAILVVLATAAVGITIYLRAQAWEPDYDAAQRPGSRAGPDAAAESGVITRPQAPRAKPKAVPSIAAEAPVPPAAVMRPRRSLIAQDGPAARARRLPPPRVAASPAGVEIVIPATRPDTSKETHDADVPALTPKGQGPTYVVRISALRSRGQALDVVSRLAARGYRATIETVTSSEAVTYLVVSEPLPRTIAEKRAQALAAVGISTTVQDRDGERVQLVFGRFGTPEDSDAAARRIRQRGYTALTLIEGGTTYVVHIGPYEKAQVDEVAGLLSGGLYVVDVQPAP
jgi:cell division septation protein DedD